MGSRAKRHLLRRAQLDIAGGKRVNAEHQPHHIQRFQPADFSLKCVMRFQSVHTSCSLARRGIASLKVRHAAALQNPGGARNFNQC
jgi:hypothetical protein